MIWLGLAILGLVMGSFVNAVVWRLHKQESDTIGSGEPDDSEKGKRRSKGKQSSSLSIMTGRSMCPACRHLLGVRDLIPLLSWLWLGGRCHYCRSLISWQYPVVEVLTAVLFVVSYAWWPLGFDGAGLLYFGFWLVFLTAFIVLAVYDIRWFLLPDRIVYPVIFLALAQTLVRAIVFGGGWPVLMSAAWGALILAGLFYVIFVISKGAWIGFGDVKLGVGLGLLVGGPLPAISLLFLASLFGSILAVPLIISGKAKTGTHLPFGPFLLLAAVAVVLFGDRITTWYTGLL